MPTLEQFELVRQIAAIEKSTRSHSNQGWVSLLSSDLDELKGGAISEFLRFPLKTRHSVENAAVSLVQLNFGWCSF